MKLKILKVQFHRNGSGVCESFFAVLFEEKNVQREFDKGVCGDKFIATFKVNDDARKIEWEGFRCINVKNFNINFRGDHFIVSLENAIAAYCNKLELMDASFCAAAFPDQYKSATQLINL